LSIYAFLGDLCVFARDGFCPFSLLITHHYFTPLREAQAFPLARSLSLIQAAKIAKELRDRKIESSGDWKVQSLNHSINQSLNHIPLSPK
jgi:hypothetical protein